MKKREIVSLRASILTLALLCALLLAGPSLQAAMFYEQGTAFSLANGVSGNGDYVVGISGGIAYRWHFETDTIDILGFTTGAHSTSNAYAISTDGSVVTGTSGAGTTKRAFRWESGTMADLGTLGSSTAMGYAINTDGTMIAGQETVSPAQGMLWQQGIGMTALGGNSIQARSMSGNGSIIVGEANGGASTQAFVSSSGSMFSLGTLAGGTTSIAYGVSADGSAVVGQSSSSNGIGEAFYYKDLDNDNNADAGEMQGLGDLPAGIFESSAWDVSVAYNSNLGRDLTIIVGWGSTTPSSTPGDTGRRAVAWADTTAVGTFTMYNLADLLTTQYGVDLTGWILTEATGISDDGLTITGNGLHTISSGSFNMTISEAWAVRVPVPEPLSLGLLVVGSVLLRRRKA